MKKSIKILSIIILSITLIIFIALSYFYFQTAGAKLDTNKLVSFNRSIVFYDTDNNLIQEQSNGKTLADISKIPTHTKNAFVAIEDKRFYTHKGIDYKGLLRATINNLKSFSFKEGGSTITQQLIKNTHLSSEKTFKRKLLEFKLAKELENAFSKEEILEKYLNTIYFGDNCYGITSASEHYFNKSPYDLDINESAVLAGIINAPLYYSPFSHYEKCFNRKKIVLENMYNQNLITKTDFEQNLNKKIDLFDFNLNIKKEYDYFYLVNNELNSIIKNSPYKSTQLNVYTYFDNNLQEIVENRIKENQIDTNKSAVLIDNHGQISAYFSTCGNVNRQLGSTIKPLLSYAPAIENNLVCEDTILLDEKINFNDYFPKNYNDVYYGNLSVKESLAKSSNICAIKLLNYVGLEKATEYLKKLDIPFSNNDKNLSLALGASENGVKLTEITGAYSVFNNNGKFIKPKTIAKITDKNGNLIYQNKEKQVSVFCDDTISIMNDMMRNTVTDGSAKKLSFCQTNLYAKTGTVGNKKGNTDAYTISYNSEYILGTWFGNKEKQFLENNVTGGTLPAITSSKIWNDIYLNKPTPNDIEMSDNVIEVEIDKISYDKDGTIVLADIMAPKLYTKKILIRKNYKIFDKSTRFSFPRIDKYELLVNNNEIILQLCVAQYINCKIYKSENGKKKEVFDTIKNNSYTFIDKDIIAGNSYSYSIVPYYINENKIYYGKEIFLEKIKSPTNNAGDNWWDKDVN